MTTIFGKIILIVTIMCIVLAITWAQNPSENEGSSILSYNSPLRQPNILRSRPYVDFLSTLYRHDSDKSNFFQRYSLRRR